MTTTSMCKTGKDRRIDVTYVVTTANTIKRRPHGSGDAGKSVG